MIMRLRLWLTILLLVFVIKMNSFASLVPFYGETDTKVESLFQSLERAHRQGLPEACVLANQLHEVSKVLDPSIRFWAGLTYAFVLLENDSITKAQQLLDDGSKGFSSEQPTWLVAYYKLNLSLVSSYQGNYLDGERLIQEALEQLGDEYRELRIRLNLVLSENLRYQGKLEQSQIKVHETLQWAEELGDSVLIANAYMCRGVIRFLRSELDRAEEDVKVFFSFNDKSGNLKNVAYGWSILGLIQYQRDNYQRSIDFNVTGYEIRKRIGDLKGQGESLNNLALGYMGLKNWNQALRYLEEAIELKTLANDLTQTTVILNNIGFCHRKIGNTEESLRAFQLALEKGLQNGQMRDAIRSLENITSIQRENGDIASAFETQSRLLDLKDSLSLVERNEAIHELEVKYETASKEQEIQLLQQDRTIITNRWLTLAMGLFLAIILGILFIDNQKRKHRHETQLLMAKDELRKAEMKNLADQLDYNQKKLALYTENLIRKNELVGQLEGRLKQTVETAVTKPSEGQKVIEDFSSVRILTEDDWNEFKELFDRVHRGLLNRLLMAYEDLTLADQRLFLLMKLELTTNQIANILGVSPDSVKKGRYRLKKKLAIEGETSLQDFVTSF